jgi:hypothetical protein
VHVDYGVVPILGHREDHLVGRDNVTLETDYPHTDSTWPDTRRIFAEQMATIDDPELVYDHHRHTERRGGSVTGGASVATCGSVSAEASVSAIRSHCVQHTMAPGETRIHRPRYAVTGGPNARYEPSFP